MKLEDITVLIDTREIASNINKMGEILSANKIQYKVEPLNPGDFRIMINNTDCHSIWERKHTDLLSSITSNHFHEQRDRMMQCGLDKKNLILLIEGDLHKKDNYELCQSVITSTAQLGFTILYTNNILDTAKTLVYYINSMIRHSNDTPTSPSSYINIKKQNITPDTMYVTCLKLISGVSNEVAENIKAKYPTLSLLKNAYDCSNKPEDLLVDVCYANKKKAKKLSEKIYQHISIL